MHLLLLSADFSPLGRLNADMLDDQTRMEILVSGSGPQHAFRPFTDEHGEYKDKCTWDGVECDDSGSVIEIVWNPYMWPAQGTVTFDHLPRKLIVFESCNDDGRDIRVSGTLSTSLLPPSMRVFCLQKESFSGTLDLQSLPDSLENFDVHANNFSGEIDLTALPKALLDLDLSRNNLSGSINFEKLPESLESLHLDNNAFEGSVCLDFLPVSLKYIDFSYNKLSGRICVDHLNHLRDDPDLRGNQFENVEWVVKNGKLVCYIDGVEL